MYCELSRGKVVKYLKIFDIFHTYSKNEYFLLAERRIPWSDVE